MSSSSCSGGVTCASGQIKLTVCKECSGAGTVKSNPTGIDINCSTMGDTCCQDACFTSGTSVTLTQTPNSFSYVGGFSGSCVSSGSTCTKVYNGTSTVKALIHEKPVLTVYKTPSSTGTVTSSPTGISCGIGCSEQQARFNYDATVTLTASPSSGIFSGDCTGTGSCTVRMTSYKSVDVRF